jgi:hypothetical protein
VINDIICLVEVFSGLRPEAIYPHQVLIHRQIGIISAPNADTNKLTKSTPYSGRQRVLGAVFGSIITQNVYSGK